jgi:hypothetical protein
VEKLGETKAGGLATYLSGLRSKLSNAFPGELLIGPNRGQDGRTEKKNTDETIHGRGSFDGGCYGVGALLAHENVKGKRSD